MTYLVQEPHIRRGSRRVSLRLGDEPASPRNPVASVPHRGDRHRNPVAEADERNRDIQPVESVQAPTPPPTPTPQPQVAESEFTQVLEYLAVLEDMVMSEGQKNNLDDEIVDRCLIVFARIQRLVPFLEELNNGDINHTVRRLVLKDLNGFITPFLRLSGENKTKNRRTLLNGIKDINMKITSIMETIEYKDLIELQTKADLIHRRYNESEGY